MAVADLCFMMYVTGTHDHDDHVLLYLFCVRNLLNLMCRA